MTARQATARRGTIRLHKQDPSWEDGDVCPFSTESSCGRNSCSTEVLGWPTVNPDELRLRSREDQRTVSSVWPTLSHLSSEMTYSCRGPTSITAEGRVCRRVESSLQGVLAQPTGRLLPAISVESQCSGNKDGGLACWNQSAAGARASASSSWARFFRLLMLITLPYLAHSKSFPGRGSGFAFFLCASCVVERRLRSVPAPIGLGPQ